MSTQIGKDQVAHSQAEDELMAAHGEQNTHKNQSTILSQDSTLTSKMHDKVDSKNTPSGIEIDPKKSKFKTEKEHELEESSVDVESNFNTLTYRHLFDIAINNKGWLPNSKSAQNFKSSINKWCRFRNLTLESVVTTTLTDDSLENYLSKTSDETDKIKITIENLNKVYSAIKVIQNIYSNAKLNASLPQNFNEAYREALDRQRLTSHGLALRMMAEFGHKKSIKSTLFRYEGKVHPLHKKRAKKIILDIEKALRLEPNVLLNRAFRPVKLIIKGSVNPVIFRQQLARQLQSKYRLKELPPLIKDVWPRIVHWRKQDQLNVNGVVQVNKPGTFWGSPATIGKVENNLLFYFGFLNLKCNVDPYGKLTREQIGSNGKGIDIQELSIRHLFDINLLQDYFNFLKARNAINKYTSYNKNFLATLCSWINRPTSFFNAHPIFAEQFGILITDGSEWTLFLKDLHQKLLSLKRQYIKAADVPTRDPYEPFKAIFDEAEPYTVLLKLTKTMETNLPPRKQKTNRAVAFRNLVVIRMLTEIPMRAKNAIELEFNKSLFYDKTTKLWSVKIPKSEMKNYYSPHSYNIDRVFSLETSRLMTRYWSIERKNLDNAESTNIFLVPSPRRRPRLRSDTAWPGILSSGLYSLLYQAFNRYFGIGSGSNMFRHIVATSLLKEDSRQYAIAAAVLNNAESSVRKAYSHVKQVDNLRAAESWRVAQVKKFQDLNKRN